MRLLFDVNIVLDVIFQRPGALASPELIVSCSQHNLAWLAWLAWHSLATLAYLIECQQNAKTAHLAIIELLAWTQIATTGHAEALTALNLPTSDFEDALHVSAALACQARYVTTFNVCNFKASPIPALTPEKFLAQQGQG